MSNSTHKWSTTKIKNVHIDKTIEVLPEGFEDLQSQLNDIISNETIKDQWSYSGTDNGESFNITIKDGKTIINGHAYDDINAVPPKERERIQALRAMVNDNNLLGMLHEAGMDISDIPDDIKAMLRQPGSSQSTPTFDAEPTHFEPHTHTPQFSQPSETQIGLNPGSTLSPGAVPKGRGLWKVILLVLLVVGVVIWLMRE